MGRVERRQSASRLGRDRSGRRLGKGYPVGVTGNHASGGEGPLPRTRTSGDLPPAHGKYAQGAVGTVLPNGPCVCDVYGTACIRVRRRGSGERRSAASIVSREEVHRWSRNSAPILDLCVWPCGRSRWKYWVGKVASSVRGLGDRQGEGAPRSRAERRGSGSLDGAARTDRFLRHTTALDILELPAPPYPASSNAPRGAAPMGSRGTAEQAGCPATDMSWPLAGLAEDAIREPRKVCCAVPWSAQYQIPGDIPLSAKSRVVDPNAPRDSNRSRIGADCQHHPSPVSPATPSAMSPPGSAPMSFPATPCALHVNILSRALWRHARCKRRHMCTNPAIPLRRSRMDTFTALAGGHPLPCPSCDWLLIALPHPICPRPRHVDSPHRFRRIDGSPQGRYCAPRNPANLPGAPVLPITASRMWPATAAEGPGIHMVEMVGHSGRSSSHHACEQFLSQVDAVSHCLTLPPEHAAARQASPRREGLSIPLSRPHCRRS
jgi:hypothetical protein